MTANEIRNRSLDGGFRAQLAATLALVAQDVVAEDAGTANHAERLTFAFSVFGSEEALASKFAFSIATVAAIQAVAAGQQVPDATLKTVVAAAWNVMRQVP